VKGGIDEIVVATAPGARGPVVHGAVIGELCREATDSRPFAFVHAENCSITRLVVFGGGALAAAQLQRHRASGRLVVLVAGVTARVSPPPPPVSRRTRPGARTRRPAKIA